MIGFGRCTRVLARVRRGIARVAAVARFDHVAVAVDDRVQIGRALAATRGIGSRRIVITAATSADLAEWVTLDPATVGTGVPAEPWTPDRPTRFEN